MWDADGFSFQLLRTAESGWQFEVIESAQQSPFVSAGNRLRLVSLM